jgi:ribosomal protein RSM22 (predicted rRNA methylase)
MARILSASLVNVLTAASGVTDPDALEARLPQLCQGVESLSQLFTRDRQDLRTSYLDQDQLRASYLAYYLPVNLAKVQALLEEMPLPEAAGQGRDGRFRVLDLGGGIGTTGLAVLDWLNSTEALRDVEGEVVTVERSAPALDLCERLWHAYKAIEPGPGLRLVPVKGDLGGWGAGRFPASLAEGTYDLIVLGNVVNELFPDARDPIRRRVQLLRDLLGLLDRQGTMMIVEPALRDTSRHLLQLRDQLVADGACHVYSPCLHEHPCPALVKEDDWCHEERPWEPPPVVAAIDRRVGFIKDALKFSYLLLRKDGQTIVPRSPNVYRVVSELRIMKGEKRAWLCNETGRPEVGRQDRLRSESNAPVDDWHRGAIIRISQIARKTKDGQQSMLGRIEKSAEVEIVRPV